MMLAAAMAGVMVTMLLATFRVIVGPTVFDRVIAVNMIGTKVILLICIAGFWAGRPDFLDLALVYGLVNFTGMVALVKYCRFGNLASDEVAPAAGRRADGAGGA